MGMLDRYRKKGGFVQLLNLIETTGKEKAEKFLKMIAEENPAWEAEIRKKILTLDRLGTWNQSYLMEVLPFITFNVIGTAMHAFPPEKRVPFLNSLPFAERKKCEEYISTAKPSPGEIATCHMKIINEVRQMVATGKLKFEKVDPEMVIPENIEEVLNSGGQSMAPLLTESDFSNPASPSPAPNATGSSGAGGASGEEATQLRRKVVALTQENQLLRQQMQAMKDKLESIRKAAA